MSYESTKAVNLPAGEDLRNNVFHLVKLVNSSGKAVVQKTTAATDLGIGIVAEEPRKDVATTGENVPVMMLDGARVMMRAAGTITAGQFVVPSTTAGRVNGVTALVASQIAVGIALESAVAGDIFEVLGSIIPKPLNA
jgi:hypothetical protein